MSLLYKRKKYTGYSDDQIVKLVNERVQKREQKHNNYGEICGGLRRLLPRFKADRKGVILRHPIDAVISAINLNAGIPLQHYISRLRRIPVVDVKMLDELAEDYYPILFHRMVKDVEYLREVLAYFGITDVEMTDNTLKRKIHGPRRKITLDQIPKDIIARYKANTQWFVDKWKLPSKFGL